MYNVFRRIHVPTKLSNLPNDLAYGDLARCMYVLNAAVNYFHQKRGDKERVVN